MRKGLAKYADDSNTKFRAAQKAAHLGIPKNKGGLLVKLD